MAKKAIDSGTQGRKKVIRRPVDLTGTNKVSIVDKCPVEKSAPSIRSHLFLFFVKLFLSRSVLVSLHVREGLKGGKGRKKKERRRKREFSLEGGGKNMVIHTNIHL